MAFLETPRFPDSISQGVTGGPKFSTLISVNDGGYEQRNKRWANPLRSWDAAHGLKDQAGLDTLYNFFLGREGSGGGFRVKDWSDYTVTTSNSNMVYSFGGIYQLGKNYVSGAVTHTRTLTKIVDASYSIYRDAVLQTEGAGAGEYSIDITTGIITIVPDVTGAISAITKANPGVVTDTAHGRTTGETLELTIAGMTELNGQTVTITVLTPDTFSIGVNTTAYSTFTSGSWKIYAQAGEVYTYSAEFDVPCRFGTDQMAVTIESYNNFSWGQIPIVEIR